MLTPENEDAVRGKGRRTVETPSSAEIEAGQHTNQLLRGRPFDAIRTLICTPAIRRVAKASTYCFRISRRRQSERQDGSVRSAPSYHLVVADKEKAEQQLSRSGRSADTYVCA